MTGGEEAVRLLWADESAVVCIKPQGVRSTDEPGGLPQLVRAALGEPDGDVRTVHRLDQVVGGVMVLARGKRAASALSAQVREGRLGKEYLAVMHWQPHEAAGTFTDLLARDPAERKTYVVKARGKGVQEAKLHYRVLAAGGGRSLAAIRLVTGRTHQIRAQFSARGLPLVGDRKYSRYPDEGPIALWSCRVAFDHPITGQRLTFAAPPPDRPPWTDFAGAWDNFLKDPEGFFMRGDSKNAV